MNFLKLNLLFYRLFDILLYVIDTIFKTRKDNIKLVLI